MFKNKARESADPTRQEILDALDAIYAQIDAMETGSIPYSQEVLDALVKQSRQVTGEILVQSHVIDTYAKHVKKKYHRNYLEELAQLHTSVARMTIRQVQFVSGEADDLAKQAEQIVEDCPAHDKQIATLYRDVIQDNVTFLKLFYAPPQPAPVAEGGN